LFFGSLFTAVFLSIFIPPSIHVGVKIAVLLLGFT